MPWRAIVYSRRDGIVQAGEEHGCERVLESAQGVLMQGEGVQLLADAR